MIVWGSRAIGWALIALAVASAPRIGGLLHLEGSLRVFSSLVLGLVGLAWVVGLELFLRFFNKFLSRN
jgi:hypothetical protein